MAGVKDIFYRKIGEAIVEVADTWPNNTAAALIRDDFLKLSEFTLRRNLERPSERYKFELTQGFPIIKREVERLRILTLRRFKPRAVGRVPWRITVSRNLPVEIFKGCLKEFVMETCGEDNVQLEQTRCRCTMSIDSLDKVDLPFKECYPRAIADEEQYSLLSRTHPGRGHSRVICSAAKPVTLYYSYTTETLKLTVSYGFWTQHGVPQNK